ANSTHVVVMRPQFTEVPQSLLDRDGDVLVAPGRWLFAALGPAAPAVRRRPFALDVFDHRPDHRHQRDAVVGDHGQHRMRFAGDERGKRAHRAPHLLALAGRIAAGRGGRRGPYRRIEAVQDSLRQLPQLGTDVGVNPTHAGHTSGLGRKRTVNSLPPSWASITLHRRRHDAPRTRRGIPETRMMRSSSTRPNVNEPESTCGNSSRSRYTASSPEPDSRSTIGRSGPGGGDPSRRWTVSSNS